MPIALALLLLATPAPRTPPEELFFGLTGLEQRVVFTRAVATRSGAYDFELLELDRLAGASGPQYRLIVACTPADGSAPPADLTVLGEVYAATESGRELPVRAAAYVRGGTAWLTFTLEPGATADMLRALAATVGPVPPDVDHRIALPLDLVGQATPCEEVDSAVRVSLLRRDDAQLDVSPDGPPYYSSIDSTRQRLDAAPAGADARYLTLRVHTLRPPAGEDDWRLANLRVLGGGGQVIDDWRYVRRTWRPDWGGWLGVKGRDWERTEGAEEPACAVEVEAVTDDGPAQHAGLQQGDLVVAVNGHAVGDAWSLGDLVRRSPPGSALGFELRRDGRRLTLPVKLGKQSLWPDLDEVEFQEAWQALVQARGAAFDPDLDVLAEWDWQSRLPLPDGFEPRSLELVFDRPGPVEGTSFLFRHLPLAPKR